MTMHSQISIYPRLDKSKLGIIVANYKMNGIIKNACWIRIEPYHRRALIVEHGICRKICKKSTKQLKILQAIFCKKKVGAKIKYDFLIENCSQIFRQHQVCLIQNIYYDNSSDVFPVQLKLHLCRKR
ncbi:hypothetical protein ACH3XW_31205 [Acanthocheilonema viteae]